MHLRWIILTLLLGVYLPLVVAQIVPGRYRILSAANGLPNSTVTGLVQDQAGFIWIATADGLARYDGRQVSVLRHHDQPNTLLENNISRLQNLTNGTVLLQTHSGDFQRFDPLTERFTIFFPLAKQGKRKIDDGWLSPDGKTFWGLWRGEKIQLFDQKLHSIYTWDQRTLGIAANTLHSMVLASTGQVYAHSDKGLIELDPKTGQHCLIPFTGPLERRLNTITPVVDWEHVVERPNGEIMVIGQQCLHLFNPRTRQFRELNMPGPFAPKGAYALRVLSDGNVYIGIGRHLYELLPNNEFLLIYIGDSPIGEQQAFGVPYLCDRSGVLWLYTQAGKVTMIDRLAQPFRTFPYHTSWASDLLQNGLGMAPSQKTEKGSASWTRFTLHRGNLWLIDKRSLYRYDPINHRLKQTSSFTTGDRCLFKIALKPDEQGHLWLYGNQEGGLTEMDSLGRVKHFWPNSLVPQPLENRGLDVSDIQPMGSTVWMASNQGKGLYKYDRLQKKITAQLLHNPAVRQSLPTNQLMCLVADPKQPTTVLWIGTGNAGLTRFDTQTGYFQTLTEKDGLPNNTINSLQADRQGFIWAATNKGLVRLDPTSFHIRVFTQADGLQDDEFNFGVSAQLPDGRLAFGSLTGMTIFNPAAIREDTFKPPIVLSALRINNTLAVSNHATASLAAPINALERLILDHTQNFLTFEFAGLHYSKPEKIQYRYRLVGVDDNWVNAGVQNTANYTQIQPGEYTFEVMATNADGRWNYRSKQLAVLITPPFWASWWAYTFYALIFGGVIVGFVQFRVRQGRQEQAMKRQRWEADQLKTVSELKTRFFSNITHEFRTPLSLILSPTEKLLREAKHDEPTRQTLASVQRNARQLLHLINQLLDLSKLEAGGMTVSLARGNVGSFVEQLSESFRPLASQKGIGFYSRVDIPPKDHVFDADKWTTIITNLLANAFKFTVAGGEVSLNVTSRDQTAISLTVADTGIGIPPEKLPHIFDRFYQVDDTRTRAYEGSGIGLALVKELVAVLGGTIRVESQPGKGTTFTLELPVLPDLADATVPAIALPTPHPHELLANSTPAQGTQTALSPEIPLVLVIEDNAELRQFIADELLPTHRILTAPNGQEGWLLAQGELPDIVISDIMMPDMDGYELTRLLKTNSVTSHIAVMLLTARASHESRMEGLLHGADEYLTKPFHLDELHQRLHNILTRQKTLREFYYQQFTQPNESFRPEVIEDEFLQQLHAAIDTHLDDSTFGVEELARMVGMSRRTLNRKLAVVANQSANDIIRQYRLKRAAQFLLEGRNVSETAYLVGYESPAHFSLIFKEFFQKTPTEYTQR